MRRWGSERTKTGRPRKRSVQLLSEAEATQPPATPPCKQTGNRADWQGNVYDLHRTDRGRHGMRDMRRNNKSQLGNIQPMRSRIQRSSRRQRTGGIK